MPQHLEDHLTPEAPKNEAQERLKLAAQRVFSTPDGVEVLAALKARTVLRPSFSYMGADGHAMALCMALREGENSLFGILKL